MTLEPTAVLLAFGLSLFAAGLGLGYVWGRASAALEAATRDAARLRESVEELTEDREE